MIKKKVTHFSALSHQRIWVLSRLYTEIHGLFLVFPKACLIDELFLINKYGQEFAQLQSGYSMEIPRKINNPTLVIDHYVVGCQRS